MKRSPLPPRKSPLRQASSLKRGGDLRRSPMKRTPRKARPAHLRDDAYRAWIATLPCCAPGCTARPPSHAHHHSLTGERGTSQKPHDRYCMPLCIPHHVPGLHSNAGPFKGWTRSQLKGWQDKQVTHFNAAWKRLRAA